MKKLTVLLLAVLALLSLNAVPLHHWSGNVGDIGSYITLPDLDPPAVTRLAVMFEPAGPCVVNNVSMYFYQQGVAGRANVMAELLRVDEDGEIIEGGLGTPSVTINFANITWFGNATVFDFTSFSEASRTFAGGEKFAIVLSVPNGAALTKTAVLVQVGALGNSWTYLPDYGWLPNENVWTNDLAWAWTADVDYVGDFIDVGVEDLYWAGNIFWQPGDEIILGAQVKNYGIATDADITLTLYDQEDDSIVWQGAATNVPMASGEELDFFIPEENYFPAAPGYYKFEAEAAASTGDMVASNATMNLEQITFTPPGNLVYSPIGDAIPGNAYAWNAADAEVGVDFWYYAAPLKLETVGFRLWDNTWPAGAANNANLRYAIYNWVEGYPNLLYVTPDPIPCVLGQWNDYDVSHLNLEFEADESFMVAYKQVNANPNCPGLTVDEDDPISGWTSSYFWDPTEEEWFLGYDEDMLIRAGVSALTLETEAPIISVMLEDGFALIYWDEVDGAESYNLYGSNDPYAPKPWDLIVGGTADLGHSYIEDDPFHFFYATASTEADGSKAVVNHQLSRLSEKNNILKKASLDSKVSAIEKIERAQLKLK